MGIGLIMDFKLWDFDFWLPSCSALADPKQPSIAQAFKPNTENNKPKQRKLLTTKKPVLTISDDEEGDDDDVLISGLTEICL